MEITRNDTEEENEPKWAWEATGGFEPPIGVLQTPALASWPRRRGAEDGIRTRDLRLGKATLYP